MKKILVTGAGGYIGSVASYLLLQNGYEVIGLDNYSTGYKQPLKILQEKFGKEKFRYYEVDLKDNISLVFQQESKYGSGVSFDAVIHYAAHCLVDESMKEPAKYFRNNILGTLNLLETMMKEGVDRLVFSSTAAVYGEAEKVPIMESSNVKPINVYGESKLGVEKIIEWYGRLKNLNYVILRYFNVCGASDDGQIGDSKKPSTLLVQNAVRGALGIEKFYLTCPEVDTPDKTPIRDYINVIDLNEAHLKALEYLLSGGKSEVINLGTGTGNSVLEVVNQVKKLTGVEIPIEKANIRQGDDAKKIADIKKAEKVLAWKPSKTIEDSIKSLIIWYKIHPSGWES